MIDAVTALKRKKGNIDLLSGFRAWRGGAGLSDARMSKVRLFHLNVVVTIWRDLVETMKQKEQNPAVRGAAVPGYRYHPNLRLAKMLKV